MDLNEIKKILYKEKPYAVFVNATKDGVRYKVFTQTNQDYIHFLVPLNELGDVKWEYEVEAQLLIRYIIK